VAAQAVGQGVAAELAIAALVGAADAGVADAGEVAADHELDGDRAALDAAHGLGIGDGEHVVGEHVAGRGEPVLREAVEHLALERDGPEHHVEGADAVGDDDQALVAAGEVVADLAAVVLPRAAKSAGSAASVPPGARARRREASDTGTARGG
jgi:hypothetical protein